MTEYEEKQINESIQAYRNMISRIEDQIQILIRKKNQNFEYKFKITKQ